MIIAANLKTNLTRASTAKYVEEVTRFVEQNEVSEEVFVFPAISSLDSFKTPLHIGAQNAYAISSGAFTGEIGSDHLQEFGVKTILIGHSERRHILGETQEQLVKKYNYYKELGYKIVYCVGEPLEIRESGRENMLAYIEEQYKGIDTEYNNLVIAYEPVWAIGTGLTPTLADIEDIHTELKKKSTAPLLYGGSVKVNNAKEILEIVNVDGILVGSGALYAEHFCQMISYAQEIQKS